MKKSSDWPKTAMAITAYHKDRDMLNLTLDCLESLRYGRPDEVFLIDDCSPLMFEQVVTKPSDWKIKVPKYIRRDTNGGFPECANTGFLACSQTDADVFILSNNDIIFTEGWLDAILEPIRQGFDISHIRVSDSDGETTENKITEDDYYGSLWAQTREVYELLGGFDERFKNGTWEDKDHFVRAKDAGFKIGKNHAAYVKHTGRATMGKLYPKQEDFHENAQRFKDKWGYIL